MKNSYIATYVILTIFLIPIMAWAGGGHGDNVEYSANKVMETMMNGEFVSLASRVFHSQDKEREELTLEGRRMVKITRKDKGVMWQIMPEQGMYMEMPLNSGGMRGTPPDINKFDVKREKVGDERVNNVSCTKYKVIMTSPEGRKFGGFQWISKEGILVKMRALAKQNGRKIPMNLELTNLKIGKQDPSLFEPPAGFRKMGMGGFMGGGLMRSLPFGR